MKKIFAMLALATMFFSVGCGNQAKEAATDAQQKVEQTANEAKDAANAKVDEAKDAANKAADDAAAKAGEVKDAAAQKIDEISEGAKAMRESMSEISFNGIVPGFSIDEVKEFVLTRHGMFTDYYPMLLVVKGNNIVVYDFEVTFLERDRFRLSIKKRNMAGQKNSLTNTINPEP